MTAAGGAAAIARGQRAVQVPGLGDFFYREFRHGIRLPQFALADAFASSHGVKFLPHAPAGGVGDGAQAFTHMTPASQRVKVGAKVTGDDVAALANALSDRDVERFIEAYASVPGTLSFDPASGTGVPPSSFRTRFKGSTPGATRGGANALASSGSFAGTAAGHSAVSRSVAAAAVSAIWAAIGHAAVNTGTRNTLDALQLRFGGLGNLQGRVGVVTFEFSHSEDTARATTSRHAQAALEKGQHMFGGAGGGAFATSTVSPSQALPHAVVSDGAVVNKLQVEAQESSIAAEVRLPAGLGGGGMTGTRAVWARMPGAPISHVTPAGQTLQLDLAGVADSPPAGTSSPPPQHQQRASHSARGAREARASPPHRMAMTARGGAFEGKGGDSPPLAANAAWGDAPPSPTGIADSTPSAGASPPSPALSLRLTMLDGGMDSASSTGLVPRPPSGPPAGGPPPRHGTATLSHSASATEWDSLGEGAGTDAVTGIVFGMAPSDRDRADAGARGFDLTEDDDGDVMDATDAMHQEGKFRGLKLSVAHSPRLQAAAASAYPPLLNSFSRTRAAPLHEHDIPGVIKAGTGAADRAGLRERDPLAAGTQQSSAQSKGTQSLRRAAALRATKDKQRTAKTATAAGHDFGANTSLLHALGSRYTPAAANLSLQRSGAKGAAVLMAQLPSSEDSSDVSEALTAGREDRTGSASVTPGRNRFALTSRSVTQSRQAAKVSSRTAASGGHPAPAVALDTSRSDHALLRDASADTELDRDVETNASAKASALGVFDSDAFGAATKRSILSGDSAEAAEATARITAARAAARAGPSFLASMPHAAQSAGNAGAIIPRGSASSAGLHLGSQSSLLSVTDGVPSGVRALGGASASSIYTLPGFVRVDGSTHALPILEDPSLAAAAGNATAAAGLTALSPAYRAAVRRYLGYLDGPGAGELSMANGTVSPLRKTWLDAAMALLPPAPEADGPLAQANAVLSKELGSVVARYERSQRQAILNYVLRSPGDRMRLGVPVIPEGYRIREWGWGAVPYPLAAWYGHATGTQDTLPFSNSPRTAPLPLPPRVPSTWHAHVIGGAESVVPQLYRICPATRQVMDGWQAYYSRLHHALLVQLPQLAGWNASADAVALTEAGASATGRALPGPMLLSVFEEAQNKQAEHIREGLLAVWLPEAHDTLRRYLHTLHSGGMSYRASRKEPVRMLPQLGASKVGESASQPDTTFGNGSRSDDTDVQSYVLGFFEGVERSFLPLHLFEPSRLLHVTQFVLGTQLRDLASRSLHALVAYFLRFAKRRQRRFLRSGLALARQRMTLLIQDAAAAEAKAAAARAAKQAVEAKAAAAQQERERKRAEYAEMKAAAAARGRGPSMHRGVLSAEEWDRLQAEHDAKVELDAANAALAEDSESEEGGSRGEGRDASVEDLVDLVDAEEDSEEEDQMEEAHEETQFLDDDGHVMAYCDIAILRAVLGDDFVDGVLTVLRGSTPQQAAPHTAAAATAREGKRAHGAAGTPITLRGDLNSIIEEHDTYASDPAISAGVVPPPGAVGYDALPAEVQAAAMQSTMQAAFDPAFGPAPSLGASPRRSSVGYGAVAGGAGAASDEATVAPTAELFPAFVLSLASEPSGGATSRSAAHAAAEEEDAGAGDAQLGYVAPDLGGVPLHSQGPAPELGSEDDVFHETIAGMRGENTRRFCLTPSPAEVEESVMRVFDETLRATHHIPNLLTRYGAFYETLGIGLEGDTPSAAGHESTANTAGGGDPRWPSEQAPAHAVSRWKTDEAELHHVRTNMEAAANGQLRLQTTETQAALHDSGVLVNTRRYLRTARPDEPVVQAARRVVRTVLRQSLADAHRFMELYAPFEFLLCEKAKLAKFLTTSPNLEDCEKVIQQYQQTQANILAVTQAADAVAQVLSESGGVKAPVDSDDEDGLDMDAMASALGGTVAEGDEVSLPALAAATAAWARAREQGQPMAGVEPRQAKPDDALDAELQGSVFSVPNRVPLDLVVVDCTSMNAILVSRTQELIGMVLGYVERIAKESHTALVQSYRALAARLLTVPVDSAELVESERQLYNAQKTDIPALEGQCDEAYKLLDFMFRHSHTVGLQTLQPSHEAAVLRAKITDEVVPAASATLSAVRSKRETSVRKLRDNMKLSMNRLQRDIAQFSDKADPMAVAGYCDELEQMRRALDAAAVEASRIAVEESRLGFDATEFEEISRNRRQLMPYHTLWHTVRASESKLHRWRKGGPVFTLDADVVASNVDAMSKTATVLETGLTGESAEAAETAGRVVKALGDFKRHLPLIQSVCTPGMRQRHWEAISKIVDPVKIRPDAQSTLTRLLEMDLGEHVQEIAVVAEQARREFAIEESLVRMTDQFHVLQLALTSHEAVSGLKLVAADDLERARAVVADQAVHTEALQSAPFSSTPELAEPLADHAELLGDAVALFALLGTAQTGLVEASSVFGRPELAKRLPGFADQFENVQFNWSRAVSGIAERGTVVAAVDNPVIKDELEKVTALLEDLRAATRGLLSGLQDDCPRFNALSDAQLMQLITTPKWFAAPPAGVITAMFPGVHSLLTAPDAVPAPKPEALAAESLDPQQTTLARLSGGDRAGGGFGGESDSESGAEEEQRTEGKRASRATTAATLARNRYVVAVQASDGHVLPLVRAVDLLSHGGDAASGELWSELSLVLSDTLFVCITGAAHHLVTDVNMPLAALRRRRLLLAVAPEAAAAPHPVQTTVAEAAARHSLWGTVRPRLAQWVSAWPLQAQLVAVAAEWTASIENALMAVSLNAAQAAVLPDTLPASAASGGFAGRYAGGRTLKLTSGNAADAAVGAAVASAAAPLRAVQDVLNIRIALLASVARQAAAWGSRSMAPAAGFAESPHAHEHTVSGNAKSLSRRLAVLLAWHVHARDATSELRTSLARSDGGLASAISKAAAVHSVSLPMEAVPPQLKAAQGAEARGERGPISEDEEEVWIAQHEAAVDGAVTRLTAAAGQYLLASHAWARCAKMHWQLGQLGTESAHVPLQSEEEQEAAPAGLGGGAATAMADEGGAPVHPWSFLANGSHPLHALLSEAPAPMGAVGRHDVFSIVLRAVTTGDTAALSVMQSWLHGARFGSITRTDRSDEAPVFNGGDTSYRRVTTGWFSTLGTDAMLGARGNSDVAPPPSRRGSSRSRNTFRGDSRSGSRRAAARSNKQDQIVGVREQALRFSVGGSLAPYGYELLGGGVAGADACVVTPLTDRVFLHLTTSMRNHASFAAVAGTSAEAGASGAQAVCDLGAMTGRKVAVVNGASIGISGRPHALLRQLVAEVTTGGWLVVSNAHTLPVEALSVFALAAESLQQAILMRKGVANINGTTVTVSPWASVSVTLSPMGAGNDRTALPLPLARAFRPVTALAPAPEVRVALALAARGFVFAAPLAQRLISALRGVLVGSHAAKDAAVSAAATGLLSLALKVASAAADAAVTLADDAQWSAGLLEAVLPRAGSRTVWTSDRTMHCVLPRSTVDVRTLSLQLNDHPTDTVGIQGDALEFACPAGTYGSIAGVDKCIPCTQCITEDCELVGEASACAWGATEPAALPGFHRIDLTAPIEDTWSHIRLLAEGRSGSLRQPPRRLSGLQSAKAILPQHGDSGAGDSPMRRQLPSAPVSLLPPVLNASVPGFDSSARWLMVPCLPAEACEGNNVCREGHEGIACQRCQLGYYRESIEAGYCVPCPTQTSQTWLFAVLGVGVLPFGYAAYYIARRAPSTVGVSLAVQAVQLLRQAVKLALPWSSASTSVARIGAIVQIDFSLSPPACSDSRWDFIDAWYAYQAIPVFLTALCVLYFLGGSIYKSVRKCSIVFATDVLQSALSLWVTLLNLLFIGLISSALEVFSCRELGGKFVSTADVAIECSGERYERVVFWALVSLLVYGGGIATLLTVLLVSFRKRVVKNISRLEDGSHFDLFRLNDDELNMLPLRERREKQQLITVHDLLGRVYIPYATYGFNWVSVTLLHKFLLTLAATLLRPQKDTASLVLGMELSLFALLTAAVRPFRHIHLVQSMEEAVRKGHFGRKLALAQENALRKRVAVKLKSITLSVQPELATPMSAPPTNSVDVLVGAVAATGDPNTQPAESDPIAVQDSKRKLVLPLPKPQASSTSKVSCVALGCATLRRTLRVCLCALPRQAAARTAPNKTTRRASVMLRQKGHIDNPLNSVRSPPEQGGAPVKRADTTRSQNLPRRTPREECDKLRTSTVDSKLAPSVHVHKSTNSSTKQRVAELARQPLRSAPLPALPAAPEVARKKSLMDFSAHAGQSTRNRIASVSRAAARKPKPAPAHVRAAVGSVKRVATESLRRARATSWFHVAESQLETANKNPMFVSSASRAADGPLRSRVRSVSRRDSQMNLPTSTATSAPKRTFQPKQDRNFVPSNAVHTVSKTVASAGVAQASAAPATGKAHSGKRGSRVWGSNPLMMARSSGAFAAQQSQLARSSSPAQGGVGRGSHLGGGSQTPGVVHNAQGRKDFVRVWADEWRALEASDGSWPTRFWSWLDIHNRQAHAAAKGTRDSQRGALCFGLKTFLRTFILFAVSYNLLASLLCVFLFIAVQGALIADLSVRGLPLELLAALMLAIAASASIAVELVLAVMFTAWYRAADAKYSEKGPTVTQRASSCWASCTSLTHRAAACGRK